MRSRAPPLPTANEFQTVSNGVRLNSVRSQRTPMSDESVAMMHCTDCDATFPRNEVDTPAKGTLACPKCRSTDIEDV
ncbi:hypothetical protein GCM10008985_31190 [Halococcus dombrowskii]|uniref:Small CPxCG-related zinc finger protein n=1 Tax=Halococcus dombrowskii TaxID=179637 RepID=A0AAV3SJG3_HALDO